MNGINLMSATLFTPTPVPDTNWKIVTIGDFNADGKRILYGNAMAPEKLGCGYEWSVVNFRASLRS
jgi:hypothetical protein